MNATLFLNHKRKEKLGVIAGIVLDKERHVLEHLETVLRNARINILATMREHGHVLYLLLDTASICERRRFGRKSKGSICSNHPGGLMKNGVKVIEKVQNATRDNMIEETIRVGPRLVSKFDKIARARYNIGR